jgi:hypothetical protein
LNPDRRRRRRIRRRLDRLPLAARRQLLEVLGSRSDIRADLIRQMHQRPETQGLAEVLMDLEAEPEMRLQAMNVLKTSIEQAAI